MNTTRRDEKLNIRFTEDYSIDWDSRTLEAQICTKDQRWSTKMLCGKEEIDECKPILRKVLEDYLEAGVDRSQLITLPAVLG